MGYAGNVCIHAETTLQTVKNGKTQGGREEAESTEETTMSRGRCGRRGAAVSGEYARKKECHAVCVCHGSEKYVSESE